jgi:hypothetical protein
VKIAHPKRGLLPFILYKYQKRVVKEYEKHRFNILSKFRQGGLTTVTVLWCMWRCMFKLDETIMVLSKSDREAIAAGEIVKRALIELPTWMKTGDGQEQRPPEVVHRDRLQALLLHPRGRSWSSHHIPVLDEAAFIPQMEKHWKAMFPTISTGGHCICISTVNGVGNWYYDIFKGAKKARTTSTSSNSTTGNTLSTTTPIGSRRPAPSLARRAGCRKLCETSSVPVIPTSPEIINDLDVITRDIEPLRMLFPKWNNLDEAREQRVMDMDTWVRGALHIWREPVEGREYIIGVDVAGGMGEENDNPVSKSSTPSPANRWPSSTPT